MPLWVYTICAILGGTLFLCQLLMSLLGVGGDHDAGGGDHDIGGDHDVAHDVGHDASHDAGHDQGHGLGLHGLLNFRALVVGVTLFGLTGRAVASSSLTTVAVLAVAAGAGLLGLFLMALLMRGLTKLEAEGTAHIEQALGEQAVVYLTIPARNSGAGKITVKVQNRFMEYHAVTDHEAIPTGTAVEVVDLVDGETLRVAPVAAAGAAVPKKTGDPVKADETRATPKKEGGIHV